jgi:hypothetical protein
MMDGLFLYKISVCTSPESTEKRGRMAAILLQHKIHFGGQ